MKAGSSVQMHQDFRRSGIALVIVLGFLAILLIMGIGFAVSMRVERIVSRSALDHVRSRQLGEAALARVMEDIDNSLGDQMVPDWTGSDWYQGIHESVSLANGINFGTNRVENFFVGHVTNYIPLAMWSQTTNAAAFAEWVPFDYNDDGKKRLVGRYAYVILDCSGFLDANFDYDLTNNIPQTRAFGRTPRELQFSPSLLREVNGTYWRNMIYGRLPDNHPSGTTFQKAWYRLETIAEFNPLLSRYGFGPNMPIGKNDGHGTNSVNFMAFSEFPQGYMKNGVLTNQTILPRSEAEIISKAAALKNRFSEMGIPDTETFFQNLRAYVSPGNVPLNLDSYITEAVPMINEVVITNRFTKNGEVVTNEYQALVELWYPFTITNHQSYSVRIIGQYRYADPASINPPTMNFTVPTPSGAWTADRFVVVTSPVVKVVATNITSFDISDASVRASVRVLEGGSIEVDRVGGAQSTMLEIPVGKSFTGNEGFMRGKSVDDPRINWDGSDPKQWREPSAPAVASSYTLGTTNKNLTYDGPDADGHTLMYVANDDLRSVGELGQLLYDATKPWQTISLLDGPNYMPVLDVFRLSSNAISRGLVNPNSFITGVVATVYNDVPVERVPFDPKMWRLDVASARKLAVQMKTDGIAFTNVSDMRFLSSTFQKGIQPPGGKLFDKTFHESLVANSAGLFSPRQQLFTVVLAAQVLGANTNVLAEQRGVGVIWRDPYPSNGVHRIFVRNFRWLTE